MIKKKAFRFSVFALVFLLANCASLDDLKIDQDHGVSVITTVEGRWYFPQCARPVSKEPGSEVQVMFEVPGDYEIVLCVAASCPESIPVTGPCVFRDGFESGDLRYWKVRNK